MKSLKPAKPKAINFELIPPVDGTHEPEPYKILREMRERFHADLSAARIALAWRKKLKRDCDGHLILGRCVKASDLQRELVDWDFVILLNRDTWLDSEFTEEKKRALVDHELCHADAARDKDGFPKRDERERFVWRTRKHDIEEFRDVVKRHGCYKADLEEFAKALTARRAAPLFTQPVASDANAESSTEEKARTRKAKHRSKDAIQPDDPNSQPGASA